MFRRKENLSFEGRRDREIAGLRQQRDASQATAASRLTQAVRLRDEKAKLQRKLDVKEHERRELQGEVDRLTLQAYYASDSSANAAEHEDFLHRMCYSESPSAVIKRLMHDLHVARRWNDRLKAGWRKQVAELNIKYAHRKNLVEQNEALQNEITRLHACNCDSCEYHRKTSVLYGGPCACAVCARH